MGFLGGRARLGIVIAAVALVLVVAVFGAYIICGVVLRLDVPIVRSMVEPVILPPAAYDAYAVAQTWNPVVDYTGAEYVPLFSADETEDGFFERMRDVDRRSLYALTQDFPELLSAGWSYLSFDAFSTDVNPALDSEKAEELRERLLSGGVTTSQGEPVYAIDGERSILLAYTEINETPGYVVISYDRSKVGLSVSYSAFEGRWSTVREHAEYVDGVAAIPSNNYTYNSRAGYGVVGGGFVDGGISRYKSTGSESLYLGFGRDGEFAAGEYARYGMYHFSEGQGVLLAHGEPPVDVVVTDAEQQQILEHLSEYIAVYGETGLDSVESAEFIREFIMSLDDYMLQARYAWVIRANTLPESEGAAELIAVCDELGAASYAEEAIPARSAFTAIGQRMSDGATFMFGIGGAKGADVKDAPGSGATVEEMQELFLRYGVSDAAVTTSGSRVGLAWKDQNLLRVRDTDIDGGRTYGAYYFR
jgi:hypothetical protein